MKDHSYFMKRAIQLSVENIDQGGGPFGAVIVKNGEVIAEAANSVTLENDPTGHAEVNAIRQAAKKLNNFDLSGCVIYSSCEPCPMCLGAIYWARLDKLYFGNTKVDAAEIDFDDQFIYEELDLPLEKRKLKSEQLLQNEAIKAFEKWEKNASKVKY